MIETTEYKYSINFSFGTILLIILLLLMLLSNVIRTNTTAVWLMYGAFALLFILVMALLVVTRLIPALKGKVALELNEQGIVDYIRNVTIDWRDIKEITLRRGRSASTMRVVIKWESDYGKEISIPLRWIKGKDDDIYNTVLYYFEQSGFSS